MIHKGMEGLTIALDTMGGDLAPREMVAGAVLARDELGLQATLVGRTADILHELAELGEDPGLWPVVDAPDVIGMGEEGARAVRAYPESSITLGARLVKDGKAGAFVSAGNTGAAMAASLLSWGRISGVKRPAIAAVLPPASRPCILLDVGANADCHPEYLRQFALMGTAYARLWIDSGPIKVGLLNIGSEESKGNELAREAFRLLEQTSGIDFLGNIEGRDVTTGVAQVVVTDGFTGNVALKLIEGVASYITGLVGKALAEAPNDAVMQILPALASVKKELDYEEAGGAVLLGAKGICVIGHGSSKAKAVMNALRVAGEAVQQGLVQQIESLTGSGNTEES